MFQTKKPQDNIKAKLRDSLPIKKESNKIRERFNTMVSNQKIDEKRRSQMWANSSSMLKKVDSSNVQNMKNIMKNKELSKKEEEEERQIEIKRRKTADLTNKAKMNEIIVEMAHDQEKADKIRKVSTLSSMDEKVDSDAVQRMQEKMKKIEIT